MTRPQHDATEAAFAPFTDDPAGRLDWFLAAQAIALDALLAAREGAPAPEEGRVADELRDALAADCAARGQTALPGLKAAAPLDTLAVGYIVLGSRLGTVVLAEMLARTGARRPAAFSLAMPAGAWRAFRARLDLLPPDGTRAARVAAHAGRGFDVYRAAAALAWDYCERPTP
ncbi:hypothetical protein [Roseivivax isoporae]|uniref:hypothetical protein n=1 Tax=Roseivivax isoporae TaxID=591206 RepID=UPI0004AE26F7|nr:hypothetical protein [Roseivivax isoporae]